MIIIKKILEEIKWVIQLECGYYKVLLFSILHLIIVIPTMHVFVNCGICIEIYSVSYVCDVSQVHYLEKKLGIKADDSENNPYKLLVK